MDNCSFSKSQRDWTTIWIHAFNLYVEFVVKTKGDTDNEKEKFGTVDNKINLKGGKTTLHSGYPSVGDGR